MTLDEFAAYAEMFAQENGEAGTLSARHLQRLIADAAEGRAREPRPATRRLLELIFGIPVADLLQPVGAGAVVDVSHAENRAGGDDPALLMAAAEQSAEFLAWAEIENVGNLTVEQIHSDVRRLARAYLKTDTQPLFERAVSLRDRVFELIKGYQRPSQTRELFSAAGWTLTLMAWISVDLGRPDIAETHLRTARFCADRADHGLLRAWIAATQHTAAFWSDDYLAAATHARNGLVDAPFGSSAAMFLTGALALDLARNGDQVGARAALVSARQRADERHGNDSADGMEGPFACTVARAGGFWSDARLTLGEPDDALHLASAALDACDGQPLASRNLGSERMVRCQQVKAYMAVREFGKARDALEPVLRTGREHRVDPLVRRVAEIGALARTSGVATLPVRELASHAGEFLRRPLALPPAGSGSPR